MCYVLFIHNTYTKYEHKIYLLVHVGILQKQFSITLTKLSWSGIIIWLHLALSILVLDSDFPFGTQLHTRIASIK